VQHKFVDLTVDPVAFLDPIKNVSMAGLATRAGKSVSRPPKKPYPLQLEVNTCEMLPGLPLPCAGFSFDVVTAPIHIEMTQRQIFTFEATVRAKLELPEPVEFFILDCTPDAVSDPANPVVCSGNSDTIFYDVGSDVEIVIPSGDFHTMDITPSFFLINPTLDNKITNEVKINGKIIGGQASASVPEVELIDSFEIVPKVCIPEVGCTPALVFPGLVLPTTLVDIQNIGRSVLGDDLNEFLDQFRAGIEGPPFEKTIGPVLSIELPQVKLTEDSFFDRSPSPWIVGGLSSATGAPFRLDAEVKPTAIVVGDTVLDEGEEGTFDPSGSLEIDFDEFLIFDVDYGDGITDFSFGGPVYHAFLDDGDFTVTTVADDEHQLPGPAWASRVVRP
jgi:hypothetical protein